MFQFSNIKNNIKKYLTLAKFVYKDKRTPRISKIFLWVALAYAISPIDIIPDFIPILGYLDDIIILLLLISLAFIFVPQKVYTSCHNKVFRKN